MPDRESSAAAGTVIPWGVSRVAIVMSWMVALILSVVVAGQIYVAMIDHGHDAWRLWLWQLAGWGFWAAIAPWLLASGGRLLGRESRGRGWVAGQLAALVATTGAHTAILGVVFWWLQPYEPVTSDSLLESLSRSVGFSLQLGPIAYGLLLAAGYGLAARAAVRRNERLEAELTRARLEALRLEIQPHFLFNSLHSVAALIRRGQGDRALTALVGLSDLLRATLDRSVQPTVALAEELALLERYVELQKLRFGDRLAVHVDPAEESLAHAVPVFLLQPLVENAVRHGVGRTTRRVTVRIEARTDGERLVLRILDDGPGLAPEFSEERPTGVGLANVRGRLQRLYGDGASCRIRGRRTGGVEVRIALPAQRAPSGIDETGSDETGSEKRGPAETGEPSVDAAVDDRSREATA